jgi:uncharacterized protein (TIGR03437 family)
VHPSLPNYLWLEAGKGFGIGSDGPPSAFHQSTTNHLVTLLANAGLTWKAYEEDISGAACPLDAVAQYTPRHVPFLYFDDVTNSGDPASAYCISRVRPLGELAADLQNNAVANYNLITPNLCNDMHDCGVGTGDAWLSTEVPKILSSPAYQNGGALFITWDEGENNDGPIGMMVLSPFAKGNGYSNSIHYTHSSTLRSLEEIFGVAPLLGDAANATDLGDLFTIPLQQPFVTSGATVLRGPVSPGEVVMVFGSNLGPATATNFTVDPATNRVSTTLGGTRVLFDGTPATVLYAQDRQVNTIVPFTITGASTQLQIEFQGRITASMTLPVAASAPGVLTVDAMGTGQGLILNEDLTLNGPSNPAARGSMIVFFGTGQGASLPQPVDGAFSGDPLPQPVLPVSVSIGGVNGEIIYRGAAPTLVAGVLQVNVRVPGNISSGNALPLLLTVGTATSRGGVTVAVK